MRGVSVFCAAAIMMFPALPVAAQILRADPVIVSECLASTPRGDTDPACIGRAAQLCQQGPGGSTTPGIADCLMSEMQEWDRHLNAVYAEAKGYFAPELHQRLIDAQRAWIALREADCQLAYDRYGGGSMRSIASASCQMDHTARRTLQLRAMIERN